MPSRTRRFTESTADRGRHSHLFGAPVVSANPPRCPRKKDRCVPDKQRIHGEEAVRSHEDSSLRLFVHPGWSSERWDC